MPSSPVPVPISRTMSPARTACAIAVANVSSRPRSDRYSRCVSTISDMTAAAGPLQAGPLERAAAVGLERTEALRQLGDRSVLGQARRRVGTLGLTRDRRSAAIVLILLRVFHTRLLADGP